MQNFLLKFFLVVLKGCALFDDFLEKNVVSILHEYLLSKLFIFRFVLPIFLIFLVLQVPLDNFVMLSP